MKLISQATYIPNPSPIEEDDLPPVRFLTDNKVTSAYNANHRGIGNMPTARRCKKPDPRGYRKQFSFWLSCGYEWQRDMSEWLMDLKHRRQFASTVRNALALYRSLQEGRIDLLLEWFPHVKDELTPPSAPDTQLAAAISQLAQVIQAAPAIGQGAPKALVIPTAAPPPADDDDALTITRDETAGVKSAENFLRSAYAINGMEYDQ